MLKKTCGLAVTALMVIACSSISFGAQENPIIELGKISVPKDLEWGMKILPKGEYQIALIRGRRSGIILATIKPDETGMTSAYSVDAEVAEIKENYPQPKVDVSVVTEAGGVICSDMRLLRE